MAASLQELGKHSAVTARLVTAAEAALAGDMPGGEAELLELNLTKLKQAGHEAEEVTKPKNNSNNPKTQTTLTISLAKR